MGHDAFRDFLNESFKSRGFDYIYAFHKDTPNPHYHVICNGQSKRYIGKSFPVKNADSFVIRKELNKHLFRYGIERSTLRQCDQIFERRETLSFREQVESHPQKNIFTKDTIREFCSDIREDNILKHKKYKRDLNLFHNQCVEAIKKKTKKDMKQSMESIIKRNNHFEDEFFKIITYHATIKPKKMKQYQLEQNRKRVLKNLEKANSHIEKYKQHHDLSNMQLKTKIGVSMLTGECKDMLNEKSSSISKTHATLKDKEPEKNTDKGMGF